MPDPFLILAMTALLTDPIGQVTQYKPRDEVRVFTREGRSAGRLPVGELPRLPAPVVEARPSGLIGVQTQGDEVIYIRGIDLEFRLEGQAQVVCNTVAPQRRAGDTVVAGVTAGAGTSRDCRPGE
ncbi:hypothetical protein [Brevundimonas balnearis]|uniref:Uncharacterized protein n=1 Tax=Brevundimonas balnearis TaxID=1572858 RepID=A0ABV6R5F3_9CAUL